ncbi:N-acetylmuramidase domain-containing protein [Algoriphagus machipongonensis]|uniref:Peptidoglycan binding domain protein n=1 Tax=Algoriphagus machipongonensis TaxID=388413 RepID=A3HSP9_9BACT|nr:N-acetylmuramidase family protein [Algoriphagus machipongonensis]EAZ82867.1 putative peptidoglycan binding domain protein [Algoriphagus machipongonensis]
MQFVKYRSRGAAVSFLQELLNKVGYSLNPSGYFDLTTDAAVKDFQQKHDLVVDGKVGVKTWTILISKTNPAGTIGNKFLSEQDLIDFSIKYELELAAVKAVNEVESSGIGFLVNGKPKILFEGHVFWRQLKSRGIDPNQLMHESNATILYRKWTKKHYLSGVSEYERLDQACRLGNDPRIKEAALASASWGSYQIMGYHATNLGYPSVPDFVEKMHENERQHLMAFGRFIKTYGCLAALQNKEWANFAQCYNGSGFAENKYDLKMKSAYQKYLE